jgi:protein-tyrosine phosphatase
MTLYWIPQATSGRLAIAARPRGGDWLADDLRALRIAGVDLLVSLLEPAEAEELELADEARLATHLGLSFVALPIPDRSVPTDVNALLSVLRSGQQALENGRTVAVHCRQGVGRSALVVTLFLVQQGQSADSAFAAISSARGVPVPETDEQGRWVRDFSSQRGRRLTSA